MEFGVLERKFLRKFSFITLRDLKKTLKILFIMNLMNSKN